MTTAPSWADLVAQNYDCIEGELRDISTRVDDPEIAAELTALADDIQQLADAYVPDPDDARS